MRVCMWLCVCWHAVVQHTILAGCGLCGSRHTKQRRNESRYSVSGFPSLRVISPTGKPLKKYRGGRDVDGIVAYAKRLAVPPIRPLLTAPIRPL